MKNRSIVLVILMLAAVLTWTACGKTPEVPKETQKNTATENTKEKETQAPTVSEAPETESTIPQKSTSSERVAYPFANGFVPLNVPLPEKILDAQLVYTDSDEKLGYLGYTPANQDTLQAYLKLCAYGGLTSMEQTMSNGLTRYVLAQPGSDFWGVAYLDESNDYLIVAFDLDCDVNEDAQLEELMAYYLQELTLPTENGRNVMPQFYASVGRTPYMQNLVGSLDYCFDGAMCWTEWYGEIDLARLWRYVSDVMLCGFDVWADYYDADDDGLVNMTLLHFSNGDAEVIVLYNAQDKNATVHYKPGVSYNLISGADYAKYIP